VITKVFSRLFDSNDREVKKLQPIIDEINALEDKVKKLKDDAFPKKTKELRKRVEEGEDLMLLLPEAFALAREAARRSIGLRHYDVQLMGGIALAQGKVAEQKTGEGKTLTAVLPLYLHALTGDAVHLVTVNDYLARRDAGWMGAIFHFLGLSTSSIISQKSFIYDTEYEDTQATDFRLKNLRPIERREAYECDIVYGINSEFGFDYLRDNMATSEENLVQTGHYFAIVDEVDSVLIDEARTPHIISAPDATPSQQYFEYAQIVEKLKAETDYQIDEKLRTAHLTDHGIAKLEKLYGVKDMYVKDYDKIYHIEAALKARALFRRDKDYIVRDNQVILVDEFTGRLMEGRRLSEGLHQAIEAKEGVPVQRESKTLATISLQNYFRMYDILAGMTGTAVTEAEEFAKIYNLEVLVVPTNREIIREDKTDRIYKTSGGKVTAIVNEVEEAHKKGQPVLVGTTSIDKNDIISNALKRRGIPHEVLNAKNHAREALIIRDAGRKGAVTVATNMAGRGVDIVLGGQPPSSFETQYQTEKGKKKFEKEHSEWKKASEEVKKAGGLFVIGTEKHESRRIDNQLRGRSGRQGDPGKSVFIVSLEDDLMRIFGGDQIKGLMERFNFPEDEPLTHGLVTRVINQAQTKVEGFHFESRKHLLEYDDVLNKQREIIYDMRRDILEDEENIKDFVYKKLEDDIARIVASYFDNTLTEDPIEEIVEEFATIIPFDEKSQDQLKKQLEQKTTQEEAVEFLVGIAKKVDNSRRKEFGDEVINRIFKVVSLSSIDNRWMDHLTAIDDLRGGVRLRGYAQRDPLVEYKNEAFTMFENLIIGIDDDIIHRVFKVNPVAAPQRVEQPKAAFTNTPASEVGEDKASAMQEKVKDSVTRVNSGVVNNRIVSNSANGKGKKKLGRNDPCWCGSGKKWKKCHYPQLPVTA